MSSVSVFADVLKDKDGDLIVVDPEYGHIRDVNIDKSMGPFTIISSNIIRAKDSTLYVVTKYGNVSRIHVDNDYKPYTGILDNK